MDTAEHIGQCWNPEVGTSVLLYLFAGAMYTDTYTLLLP